MRWSGRSASLLLLHEEGEFLARRVAREEQVAGLARESLEVLDRARVGGEHLQHLPGLQVGQRLLRLQDRQRAVETPGVQFLVEIHKVLCRMDTPGEAGANWLVMVAQLPTEDPASRMRVLRTLESLGAAVIREGAYLLPSTPATRQSLESLADYIAKTSGAAHVLDVTAASPAQNRFFISLFDRSARYESLI